MAFDTDRTFEFGGFKLDWTTDILTFNLNDPKEALKYIRQQMIYITKRKEFKENGAVCSRSRSYWC